MTVGGAVAQIKASVKMGMPPRRAIARAIAATPSTGLFALAQQLSRIADLRVAALGTPLPQNYQDICGLGDVIHALPANKVLPWTAAILRLHAEAIRSFIAYESAYDALVSVGNWPEALAVLNQCEKKLGVSLWLMANKLIASERVSGVDAQKAYLASISRDDQIPPAVRIIAHFRSMCAEATLSADSYYDYVKTNLDRELTGPILQYLRFHVAFFGPFRLSNPAEVVEYEMTSSVIDRFLTLVRVGQMLYADEGKGSYKKPYADALRIVAGTIDDRRIRWLLAAMDISAQPLQLTYSESLATAFDEYTAGNYNGALLLLKRQMQTENQTSDLIELMAACSARLLVRGTSVEQWEHATGPAMVSILLTDANLSSSISKLKKEVALFSYANDAPALDAFLKRRASTTRGGSHARHERMGDLSGSPSNPRSAFFVGKISQEARKALYPHFLHSITFALFASQHQRDISASLQKAAERIPMHRRAKYQALAALESNNYGDALSKLETAEALGDPLDQLDASELRCMTQLAIGTVIEASRVASRAILKHPTAQGRFPLEAIWRAFDQGTVDLAVPRLPIEVPNVLGLHAAFRRRGREYRMSTVCEDFFYSWAVVRPTQLRAHQHHFDRQQLVFFLREVCIVAVLDSHGVAYLSQAEVEDERVSILQWLIEINPLERAVYADEIADITRLQRIRAAMHTVETSKVNVNIPGVKSELPPETQESLNRYLSLPYFSGTQLTDLLVQVADQTRRDSDGKTPVLIVLPRSERLEELGRFYEKVKEKFVFSNDFGLDAHLSAGIRHVILPNQLRACFERQSLITERTGSGAYAANKHWDLAFQAHGVADERLDRAHAALDRYSTLVDVTITELRDELLRVKGDKYPRGIFDFNLKDVLLERLDVELTDVKNYEQAVDTVVDILWDLTDDGLKSIRDIMGGRLKQQVVTMLDDLGSSIRESSGCRIPVIDGAITKAATDISDELDVVVQWFQRSRASPGEDYDLGLAVDIARAMVSRCYVTPRLDLKQLGNSAVTMKAFTLNGMVNIFFWLFDNALQHGRASDGALILALSIDASSPRLRISASNTDRMIEDASALEASLAPIRAQIAAQATSERVRGEGKSGLIKIARAARIDLNSEATTQFGRRGETFCTTVTLSSPGLWA
jgi:hypothetical protein